MPIKLNSTGGGSVTLDPGSISSTYTHTLPARTGTLISNADTGTVTGAMIASNAIGTSNINPGAAGQGLVTNSSGSSAWAYGAKTLLNTITASNSSAIQDTTSLTSTYQFYSIEFYNLVPATNAVNFYMQHYVGGSYSSSGYNVQAYYTDYGSSGGYGPGSGTWSQVQFLNGPIATSTASYGGISGIIWIFNPSQTTSNKGVEWYLINLSHSSATQSCGALRGAHVHQNTGAMTGFQLYFSSGNVTSGTTKVYGWN